MEEIFLQDLLVYHVNTVLDIAFAGPASVSCQ